MPKKSTYNKITDEEKISQINPINVQLMDEWIMYLKINNRTAKTIYNYENDLNIFFVWVIENANNKSFIDLGIMDIVHFQNYCSEEWNWGSSRIIRIKDTLSSFSNFINIAFRNEYPEFRNIIRDVPQPHKEKVKDIDMITEEELQAVTELLFKKGKFQAACIMNLACFSGCRKTELVQFDMNYFDNANIWVENREFYKTPCMLQTKAGIGVAYRYRYIYRKEMAKVLHQFKKYRRELGVSELKPLFFTTPRNGAYKRITNGKMNEIQTQINSAFEKLGIDKTFTYTMCRNYYTRKVMLDENLTEYQKYIILDNDFDNSIKAVKAYQKAIVEVNEIPVPVKEEV